MPKTRALEPPQPPEMSPGTSHSHCLCKSLSLGIISPSVHGPRRADPSLVQVHIQAPPTSQGQALSQLLVKGWACDPR